MYASDGDGPFNVSTPHIKGLSDRKRYPGHTEEKRCEYEVRLENLDGCCVFHLWSIRGKTVCNAAEIIIDQLLWIHAGELWFPQSPDKIAWVDHGETLSIIDIEADSYLYIGIDFSQTSHRSARLRLSEHCRINWINAPFDVEELLTHKREVYRKIASNHLVQYAT